MGKRSEYEDMRRIQNDGKKMVSLCKGNNYEDMRKKRGPQGDPLRRKFRWTVPAIITISGGDTSKFGKVQGRRCTEGLMADSYVKLPGGSESGLRLWV